MMRLEKSVLKQWPSNLRITVRSDRSDTEVEMRLHPFQSPAASAIT